MKGARACLSGLTGSVMRFQGPPVSNAFENSRRRKLMGQGRANERNRPLLNYSAHAMTPARLFSVEKNGLLGKVHIANLECLNRLPFRPCTTHERFDCLIGLL